MRGAVLDGGLQWLTVEHAVDAARVEPADAELAEEVVPVDVVRPELRRGGEATVADADGAADAEAALGEVQAVADGAADAVVVAPLDELRVDAALEDEVFDEAADLVVRERGDDRGAEAERARRPPVTLYSPPPSQAANWRVVRMRPAPGSSRSMTSPSATAAAPRR